MAKTQPHGSPASSTEPGRWDDVRVFLALMRGRTLGAAATRLGVDATTVGRRLTALEQALGASLFDRTRDGVLPTAAAEQLLAAAEALESRALALFAEANALETSPEGVVRLTTPPVLAEWVLVPLLPELTRAHPKLRLEIDARVSFADLTRREADIAIRTRRPTSGDLVVTKLMESRNGAFASAEAVEAFGVVRDLSKLPWIGWTEDFGGLPTASWLARHVAAAPVLRASALSAQLAAAQRGLGAVLVSERLAPLLHLKPVRTRGPAAEALATAPSEDLWLVSHRALRDVPRVRVVWERLVQVFARLS